MLKEVERVDDFNYLKKICKKKCIDFYVLLELSYDRHFFITKIVCWWFLDVCMCSFRVFIFTFSHDFLINKRLIGSFL